MSDVGRITPLCGSIPTEQAAKPVLDIEGMTVTLVGDAANGGLCIRKWVNHGLEGGTHHLVAEPLARREAKTVSDREVRLVLAARAVSFGDGPDHGAIRELDGASEAYAADVPWDDEPERPDADDINWKVEWEAVCSRNIRLAEAARPFADVAIEFNACGDGQPIGIKAASGRSDLRVGDLRALATALATMGPQS